MPGPKPATAKSKGSATPVAKGKAEQLFPNIAAWVDSYGWIEIGQDDYSRSFIRALDPGGMVWEGKAQYESFDNALRALNKALGKLIEENG